MSVINVQAFFHEFFKTFVLCKCSSQSNNKLNSRTQWQFKPEMH